MPEMSERIEELMRNVAEQAQKADELKSAVENARGSATSADRSVTVTAAPSGAVLDLQLSAQATHRSPAVLQKTLLATIREATRNASEQLDEVAEPLLGDRFGQFQELLKAGRTTGSGQDAATPARNDGADEEDDFRDEPYLR